MDEKIFSRGDVVLVPFPYVTDFAKAKSRPALVVQNDIANKYSPNLILALISSRTPQKVYPFHFHIRRGTEVAKKAGLTGDSIVKTEVIITIPKSSVMKRIGSLPAEAMGLVDQCLRISMNL
ncbi:MAG: type II toxin-antitoxin system PemK/MazF family toxin [Deltaproteobacteria bacterium]|nr:type II toxin-antitoxin system PemK/MazF family toxin [Deltaproteobacteria bacterium]